MTTSTDVVPLTDEQILAVLCGFDDRPFHQPKGTQFVYNSFEDEHDLREIVLRRARELLALASPTSEVQADHIAGERKMVVADLYLWLAGSNDNRFIRAWTDDPARVDSLREAIGLEPARYYAAPAQPCGDAEQADVAVYREVGVWEPNGSKFKTYSQENLNGKAMYVRDSK
ncbi:hypothetical protein R69746_05611 [Paraburkholderia aspalathi]|uniref:hypothetical protein n=1 Tax=Paraburkholderia aspalathi TaxID=1324617 RepID=UPI00190AAE49|nr:hypothetical protein [Paraburkholderia aspalathi]MBK3841762.1 hypothetical protein [Paraburkholderia aspalathi]CAE6810849.1 hypothetical protein R69746_05611 [Paraburkholderia aspalathi]